MNYKLVIVFLFSISIGSIQATKGPNGQQFILPFLDKVKYNEPLTDEDFNTLLYGTNLVISECENTLYTHGLDPKLQNSTEYLLINVRGLLTKYCKNNTNLLLIQQDSCQIQLDKVKSLFRILNPEVPPKHFYQLFKKSK